MPVIIVIQQWKYILYCYMVQSLRITRWCISDSSVSSLAYCNYLGIRYITDEEIFTLTVAVHSLTFGLDALQFSASREDSPLGFAFKYDCN